MTTPQPPNDTGLATIHPAAKLHQVFLWLVQGGTEFQIREAIADKFPGDDATLLIASAMDALAANAQVDKVVMAGWCFEAYRELYRRMLASGDFAGALRAVKMIADIAETLPDPPEAPPPEA